MNSSIVSGDRSAAGERTAALFSTVRGALRRFWLEPASSDSLAFLRVAVAALGLIQLSILWPYLLSLYGNFGFIQWAVTETTSQAWFPSIGKLALLLEPRGVSSAAAVYGVFGLYGVSLLGLLLGYRARASAALAWLTHSVSLNSGFLSLYGVDTMLHVLMFYLVFAPSAGRWSLDALAGRASPLPSAGARVVLRTMQVHLCVIYLNTGLGKASGEQWWSGEALWRAVMQPQFNVFDFSWLTLHPGLAKLACWGVLAVELGYAAAIWVPALRRPWLVSTLMLHAGIALCMRLWLFSLVMAVFNLATFGWRQGALRSLGSRPTSDGPDIPPGAVLQWSRAR